MKILLIWMMICMITERIEPDDEFLDPNVNYRILMSILQNRILVLEKDFENVQDASVKGYIQQELFDARKEYFNYLKIDLELQHLVLSNPDIYGAGDE